MATKDPRDNTGTLRAVVRLARPYKKRFIVIALLALLGTAADLIQPLIYRIAINDVAGLFVDRPSLSDASKADQESIPQVQPPPKPQPEHPRLSPSERRRRQQEQRAQK